MKDRSSEDGLFAYPVYSVLMAGVFVTSVLAGARYFGV